MKRTGIKRGTSTLTSKKQMKQRATKGRKKTSSKSSALTKNAEGQQCTLRLPGCLPGTETVVFAHYRRFGWGGMGLKPNDLLGCFACASCHDKQERYHSDATYEDLLRAMGETLMKQAEDGLIVIG